jgi:pimeloyl-ACP methyl ester carboxylesterase
MISRSIYFHSARPYLAIALFLILVPVIRAHDYTEKRVILHSSSGYAVAGVHYVLKDKPGPAMLLLHDIGGDHTQWIPYLDILEKAGINSVLAIDLRGHGDSDLKASSGKAAPDSQRVNWRDFSEEDFGDLVSDFQVAWDYLKTARATDSTRMAAMGCVAGANYAAVFSAANPDVRSLVLLSPGVVYRGVGSLKAIQAYGARPVLFAASKEDPYSAGSCRRLKENSDGRPAHLEILEGSGRGVDLIDINPGFKHFLSDWFRSTL